MIMEHAAIPHVELLMDALATAFAVGDHTGAVVYCNRSLHDLAQSGPIGNLVLHGATALLRLAALGPAHETWEQIPLPYKMGVRRIGYESSPESFRYVVVIEPEAGSDPAPAAPECALTQREQQVARLVADGASAKEVAQALHVSVHTARRHTESVFRKMSVDTRGELARRMYGRANATEKVA